MINNPFATSDFASFITVWMLFGYSQVSVAMATESVVERWLQAVQTRKWVTTRLESGRSADGKTALARIIVKQGTNERIAYEADATAVGVGWPFVSPDGTKLAFTLRETVHGRDREAIYTMDTQGSEYRELLEILPDLTKRPPDTLGIRLAWSHDNKKILFGGMLSNSVISPPNPRKFGEWGPAGLFMVDVNSGKTLEQLSQIGKRVLGSGIGGPIITSQAWSPDNQRFVFMNDAGIVSMFNIATREVTELGAGRRPTWSPDGRLIAMQKPGHPHSSRGGDFVVVSVGAPHRQEILLANSSKFTGLGLVEALWLPDPRYVVVFYYPGERGFAYVFDRTTGALGKLSSGFWGHSWGGRN